MLLYILHFYDKDFFKIGVTNNIYRRIRQIRDNFRVSIDLDKTIIVTNTKQSRIKRLERNLLDITSNFQYQFPDELNIGAGKYEFRELNCQKLVMQFISEQENYKLNYTVYKGLDLSGQYNITIPKAYYPIDILSNFASDILISDLNNYCTHNKLSRRDFFNELLYEKACQLGIDRSEGIVNYDNYYKYKKK